MTFIPLHCIFTISIHCLWAFNPVRTLQFSNFCQHPYKLLVVQFAVPILEKSFLRNFDQKRQTNNWPPHDKDLQYTAYTVDTVDTVGTVDTVNTVHTVDTVDTADTVDTVYTTQTVLQFLKSSLPFMPIYCKGRLERYLNGLMRNERKVEWVMVDRYYPLKCFDY